LEDGRIITVDLYHELLEEEIEKIKTYVGPEAYQKGRFMEAIQLFGQLVKSEAFMEFFNRAGL
jgi:malate synthase